jgi:tetratricopeptide (TPR) repeat protein
MADYELDFSAYIAERTRDFTGREWVFAEIDAWLASKDAKPVFLLTGSPGSGKTAVATRLVQMSLSEVASDPYQHLGRDSLASFHFCQANFDATLNPLRFIEALSRGLANRYDAFREALLKTGERAITINASQPVTTAASGSQVQNVVIHELRIGAVSARSAFDRVVRSPLEALVASGFNRPLVVLVDSLDEALIFPDKENLVTLLRTAGDLHPHMRFVLTSRPDKRVTAALGERTLDLIEDAPADMDDVRTYAEARLGAQGDPKRMDLARSVAKASQGNFLYARHKLDEAIQRLAKGEEPSAIGLPEGLDGIYREFLKRKLASNLDHWEERYRPVLGLLAVARGEGLTSDQIARITKQKQSQTDGILRRCEQFLAGPDDKGRVRIYHQSFREFLLQDADFHVYPDEAHASIADYYWSAYYPDWQGCDAYGLDFLAIHLLGGKRRKELGELLTASPKWIEAKSADGEGPSYIDDVELAIHEFSDPLTPPQLVELVQLYVAREVSLRQAYSYSANDLRTLVWLGRTGEAVLWARSRSQPPSRFYSLLTIYDALADKGPPDPELLTLAQEAVDKIEDPDVKLRAFIELAAARIDAGPVGQLSSLVSEAAALASQARDDWWSGIVALAVQLASKGYQAEANLCFEEVRHVGEAQEPWTAGQHVEALSMLSKALSRTHRFADAERTAREIRAAPSRTNALATLAVEMFSADRRTEAQSILEEVRESVVTASPDWKPNGQLLLANALAQMACPEEASLAYDKVERSAAELEPRQRVEVLANLGQALALNGFEQKASAVFEAAQQIALSLPDDVPEAFPATPPHHMRARSLHQLVEAMVHADLFAEAASVAAKVEGTGERAEALFQCVEGFVWNGRFGEAQAILQQIEDDEYSAKAQRSLGMAFAQAGRFAEARRVAAEILDDGLRADVLSYLAASLAYSGTPSDIPSVLKELEIIKGKLVDSVRHARTLLGLAQQLLEAGCRSQADHVLDRAMNSCRSVRDAHNREEILIELTTTWAAIGNYESARTAARDIEGVGRRAYAYQQLAAALARSGCPEQANSEFDRARASLVSSNMPSLHPVSRAQCLDELAVAALKSGCVELANQILLDAKRATRIALQFPTAGALAAIEWVLTLIQFGSLDKALAAARRGAYRAEGLMKTATAMSQAGRKEEALVVFKEARAAARGSPEKLVSLAEQLQRLGYTAEAQCLFKEAEGALVTYESADGLSQASSLICLAPALFRAGYHEKASEVFARAEEATLTLSPQSVNRAEMLYKLAVGWAAAGEFEAAKRAAYAIEPREANWPRRATLRRVAMELAMAHRFAEALSLTEADDLDDLLQLFLQWLPSIEQVDGGLAITILQQAARVAGWFRPDWENVRAEIGDCWQAGSPLLADPHDHFSSGTPSGGGRRR